ncbi:LysR family transcriptional regulator [Pseudomonas veronii]|jgi:DNA-binding transcriptional LysR family regulator|uniref:LysR family transcriptional regulator n=1 Tax=Pseudomonas TaxID=286 RepID=UPI0009A4DDC8|nr:MULTISPECIES: LysR family transcriptional regulator [Pseudomonas]AQY64174.1 LysR family transcriptional regulator [Pseudomonas veronii]MCT8961212.1 LysR family transcriptional regulator [Pseudomonas veronii]MCT9823582.1 LysR family transcriptional regulator [Pseudomonas veronii]NWC59154.1 LysR family transcriptional regulator [Pseudomonas veronii]PUB31175.1 DNA-binding transcriptional LysR family regulator [Pseudomonas sp. GV105]
MKTPCDLSELDAFAAVARHHSFRKAADERGVSASALSHAMRALEGRLGVRLLNRTTRSVTPTEAGNQLLATLVPALAEIAKGLHELTFKQEVPTGTLRLNVSRPAAHLVIAPLLAPFTAAYPRVNVELVADDGLSDIIDKGFDAGVRFGESLAGDMIAVPVGSPQGFVTVAAPGYLRRHGTPDTPQRLLEHACIGRRFPSGKLYKWEYRAEGQPMRLAVAGPLILEDDTLMIQAAKDGAGIAYVYEEMARDYMAQGQLEEILEDWKALPSRFFIYYSSRRHVPPALQALIEFVRETQHP